MPTEGLSEEKIGPRPSVWVCKGCPAYETEKWREPSGDGETYDRGQYAWCNAAGRKSMGAYHYDHSSTPEWCPAHAEGPAPPGGGGLSPKQAWQDLLDKDDRTSPAEYPEMALITFEELADYMAAALQPETPDHG